MRDWWLRLCFSTRYSYFFRWHFYFGRLQLSAWNLQLLFTCQGATERLVDPGWCCWNAQINGYNLSKIRSQVDQQLCMFFLHRKWWCSAIYVSLQEGNAPIIPISWNPHSSPHGLFVEHSKCSPTTRLVSKAKVSGSYNRMPLCSRHSAKL